MPIDCQELHSYRSSNFFPHSIFVVWCQLEGLDDISKFCCLWVAIILGPSTLAENKNWVQIPEPPRHYLLEDKSPIFMKHLKGPSWMCNLLQSCPTVDFEQTRSACNQSLASVVPWIRCFLPLTSSSPEFANTPADVSNITLTTWKYRQRIWNSVQIVKKVKDSNALLIFYITCVRVSLQSRIIEVDKFFESRL